MAVNGLIVPDHPVIRNMERTGWPDGKEQGYPRCPVCGAECDTVYVDRHRDVLGCERCVKCADAWDALGGGA